MKKKNLLILACSLLLVGCTNTKSDSGSSINSNNSNINASTNTSSSLPNEDSSGENMMATTKVVVHYARNDADYSSWGIWTWQAQPSSTDGMMIMFDKSDGVYGNYATIDLSDERYNGAKSIGFICKTHSGSSMTTWTSGLTDISKDRFISVPEMANNGIYEIYLYEGVEDVMTSLSQALKDKIVTSDFTSNKEIKTSVILSSSLNEITKEMVHIYENEKEITFSKFSYANKSFTLSLDNEPDISKTYSIKIDFPNGALSLQIGISYFYDTQNFIDAYTYYGDDLGVSFNNERTETTFKLWAPISSKVYLNLYEYSSDESYEDEAKKFNQETQKYPNRIYEMNKSNQGVWQITIPSNLHGKYYTYTVVNGSTSNEIVDPYARSCGVDGLRGMVVDFNQVNEKVNWNEDVKPNRIEDATDASIYEVHVRDVTIDSTSGVSEEKRGLFSGLGEKNTYYSASDGTKVSTGLSSIKELGVTHIQLQPVYDYSSVDEATKTKYNWGYDPMNYNCLEGSYSSNPFDGLTRIYEFKNMIKSVHEENLLVNIDVVFNHTFSGADSNFEKIIPGYYHRMNENGTFSDGSGCGNEMASERLMYRKFVVDSCKFYASEYNISGFRFDLMALLDTTTMELVYKECKKIDDKIMVYGEPWSGGTSLDSYTQSNKTTIQGIEGVAAFNDSFRDAVRGDNSLSKGWIQDSTLSTNSIIQGIWGQFSMDLTNPLKTLNYVSCHDNYALFDQIDLSNGSSISLSKKIHQVEEAQGLVFMSQGIAFIHGGEEFLRTKSNGTGNQIHNSYNAGDEVNKFDYSRKATYLDTYNFMKQLLTIRNSFKGFRLTSYQDIANSLKVNKQDSYIDYEINYDNQTYRVILNGNNISTVDVTGYNLICSNYSNTKTSSTLSLSENEMAVLKK